MSLGELVEVKWVAEGPQDPRFWERKGEKTGSLQKAAFNGPTAHIGFDNVYLLDTLVRTNRELKGRRSTDVSGRLSMSAGVESSHMLSHHARNDGGI